MSPGLTFRTIQNSLQLLLERELLHHYERPVKEESAAVTVITYPGHQMGLSKPIAFGAFPQYKDFLRYKQFTAILTDGSLLRVTYEFYAHDLARHSLWFWPCPFEIDPEYFQMDGVLEVVEGHQAADCDALRMRSPLRFDYDPEKATREHSQAHLHMHHHDCRIPVTRPVSFNRFVGFIFRRFYPHLWEQHDFWDDLIDDLCTVRDCPDVTRNAVTHIRWV